MTKFQKIQKLSSIIPVFSTAFVSVVTMLELKRRKASFKLWIYFVVLFFVSGTVAWLVNTYVMTGQNPFLNIVVIGGILAIANLLMVDLQVKVSKNGTIYQDEKTKKPPLSRAKKITIIAVSSGVGSTILLIAIIYIIYMVGLSAFNARVIEDINGSENKTLAVITLDEMMGTNRDYASLGLYTKVDGENTEITNYNLKECDYDTVNYRVSEIHGVLTLQATKTDADQMDLEIQSEVVSGNMEIIIVVDNECYKSVAANETCFVSLSDISGKLVLVKMGAESAELQVTVKRTIKDSRELPVAVAAQ